MSAPAAAPEPNPLAAHRAENREHFVRVLRRLVDSGASIADSLAYSSEDPCTVATTHHHVARAIRQGIMLADTLAAPIPEPSQPPEPPAEQPTREHPNAATPAARSEPADHLQRERPEQLDRPERQDPLPDRAPEDILLDLRRDLARATVPLTGPWRRRTPPRIDEIEAAAAAVQPVGLTELIGRITGPDPGEPPGLPSPPDSS